MRLAEPFHPRMPAALLPALLLLLLSGSPLNAQQSTPSASNPSTSNPSTINVDARLVNLPVVVRDKKGALIQNLTKDDFALQVDKHPQTIRYFNVDKDMPLTLGLLVDTSMSQRDVIDEERAASTAFLDDMLTGPEGRDKAFVVQFAQQADLLQDITSSKPKLRAALKQLDTPAGSGGKDSDPDKSGVTPVGSGTSEDRDRRTVKAFYDSLFLSCDELMSKQKGRKALIVLTDGTDSRSKESLTSSIEAAQRADTIIYAIYFKGRQTGRNNDSRVSGGQGDNYPGGGYPGGGYPGGRYPGGGYPGGGYPGGGYPGGRPPTGMPKTPDGKKVLERIANETGGRTFEISKKEPLASIYAQIGEELRAQYRLGYTPDDKTASEGYHRIELSLTKGSPKEFIVQTREGYYSGNAGN